MRRSKQLISLSSFLALLACDLNESDPKDEPGTLIGYWQQVEKRTTLATGWVEIGQGSYYNVTFSDDGTHTIQQGNYANGLVCSGTWEANGNALTMKHDCGRGESEENVHFGIEDTTLTWVYDFSEMGKRFVRLEEKG